MSAGFTVANWHPATIARHIVSLKLFCRYLQLEGVLGDSAAELLGSQKLWQRVPHVLSPAGVEKLLTTPRKSDPWWRRDRTLLELLYATGCRASESSHLKLSDVRLDEGFAICHGKGDKQRVVPLGGRAIAAIRDYLEHERPRLVENVVPAPEWLLLRAGAGDWRGSGSGSCSRSMPSGPRSIPI